MGDRVLPPMPELDWRIEIPRRRLFGRARARDLDETAGRLNEERARLMDEAAKLREKKVSLQKWELELTVREQTMQKILKAERGEHYTGAVKKTLPLALDGNRDDTMDCTCAKCGGYSRCAAFRVFHAETKRRRRTYFCCQSCALDFNDEQEDLANGLAYVKKSLGVA